MTLVSSFLRLLTACCLVVFGLSGVYIVNVEGYRPLLQNTECCHRNLLDCWWDISVIDGQCCIEITDESMVH